MQRHDMPFDPPDFTRGDEERMELSITFDGGSEADDAEAILDTLKCRGIKTTIFLTGDFIRKFPEVARRIVRDGHEAGNHTMDHPHLTRFAGDYTQRTLKGVNKRLLSRELRTAADIFKEVTGVRMSPLWRAPYGEENSEIRRWALEEGYIHVGWTADYKRHESLDSLDWVEGRSSRLYRSPDEIKRRILDFGKNSNGARGGIILMHLGTGRKADRAASMLGDLLDELMGRGYRLVKISDMLRGNKALQALRGKNGITAAGGAPAGPVPARGLAETPEKRL